MRLLPARALLPVWLGLALVPASAQGVQPLSGAYWIAGVDSDFLCGPGTSPSVKTITSGTMTFAANGTWSWSFSERRNCTNSGPMVTTSAGSTGRYETSPEGLVELDWGITNRDSDMAQLRPDGAVMLGSAHSGSVPTATWIAIRTGAGLSNQTLAGTHHVVRLVHDHRASGLQVSTEMGTIAVLPNGSWTENGIRRTIPGGATAPYTAAGTFSVQPDGAIRLGGTAIGAVASSGEIATWVTAAGDVSAWAVAVRQGTVRTAVAVDGPWGLVGHSLERDVGPTVDYYYTEFGEVLTSPITAASAAFVVMSFSRDPYGSSWSAAQGTLDMVQDPAVPAGRFDIRVANQPSTIPGAVAANGDFFVAAIGAPQQEAGLLLALRKGRWPMPYGAPAPGTGGLRPFLDGTGGFPVLGSGTFGLLVTDALPSAPAILAVALRSGAMPFGGGTIWVDLGSTSTILLPIGPGGSASLPVPLPTTPTLARFAFFAQALVLDGGALAGVAMSNGLRIELGH